jgi:hypothetical protein
MTVYQQTGCRALLHEAESRASSDPIINSHDASRLGAVGAAVEGSFRLDPVPHNPTAAMGARGRKRMDRAFEAVKGMRLSGVNDLERLVVVVPADLALGHKASSCDGNHAGR